MSMTLGVPEVARVLGLTRSAVYKAIARGTMRAVAVATPFGMACRVTPREVERYRRRHLRTRSGIEAYLALGEELSARPDASLDDLDKTMVDLALAYARRRRQAWPPRIREAR